MVPLGDDELHYIFNKIPHEIRDTSSLIQVSKQFLKVACIGLNWFHSSVPDLLFDILPSSPNLRFFLCCKPLSNTHLKLLAQSCPKLEFLDLSLAQDHDPSSEPCEFDFDLDFDDDGLCAVWNSCSHLRVVDLSRRPHVGDAGIVSLVTSCKNLIYLDLEGCIGITNESLKAIGESGIHHLNLGGCCSITDLGLEYLAMGDLKNFLDSLDLTGCDRITDNGVIYLNQMVSLAELNLSKCGVHVTDSAIVALVSQLSEIRILDLSWLINVTDISLLAIGSKCSWLREICLTGCEAITAEGLWAFSGHETLETLMLFSCYNFSYEDVESVALTCPELEYLGLMKSIRTPMPVPGVRYYIRIGRCTCRIDWDEPTSDEDSDTHFW